VHGYRQLLDIDPAPVWWAFAQPYESIPFTDDGLVEVYPLSNEELTPPSPSGTVEP
jgi:hypothetical protein